MSLATLYTAIDNIFFIYYILLIVYILSSWVPVFRHSPVGELIGKVCEPYLKPFRKIIPPLGGMIDVSPIVALFALQFIKIGLFSLIDFLWR